MYERVVRVPIVIERNQISLNRSFQTTLIPATVYRDIRIENQ